MVVRFIASLELIPPKANIAVATAVTEERKHRAKTPGIASPIAAIKTVLTGRGAESLSAGVI